MPKALWWIVDTNILSNQTSTDADANVVEWFRRYAGRVRVSVVTIAELRRGIVLLEQKAAATADAGVRSRLQTKFRRKRDWHNEIIDRFGDRVETIDVDVAQKWAEVSVHFPSLRDGDKAIAATALAKGYGVATRNLGDFRHTGVPLVDPFDPSTWDDDDRENDPVSMLLHK